MRNAKKRDKDYHVFDYMAFQAKFTDMKESLKPFKMAWHKALEEKN